MTKYPRCTLTVWRKVKYYTWHYDKLWIPTWWMTELIYSFTARLNYRHWNSQTLWQTDREGIPNGTLHIFYFWVWCWAVELVYSIQSIHEGLFGSLRILSTSCQWVDRLCLKMKFKKNCMIKMSKVICLSWYHRFEVNASMISRFLLPILTPQAKWPLSTYYFLQDLCGS